ncbi:hypothetical protein Pmani_032557 [Petrolisthes manimaculis]|uniref:RRM domain-containing protein n=1 Tax=Petrolisthes manimaculis TaxID=1843537 RepID=A0AAE1TRK1_9EUCA|nr:hypothetical protein Pmani_032557 [Petrolisthes manimaculis]
MSEDDRTVWVGGFDAEVSTEEILYELFLQAGPLQYVRIPKDRESKKPKNFGFICYLHSVSVPYAIELMDGIVLHGRVLKVQSRHLQQQQRQGLNLGPVGVHSLDSTFEQQRPNIDMVPSGPQQSCAQQSLMGAAPNFIGDPGAMISHQVFQMGRMQPQQSLLGSVPNLWSVHRDQINDNVIARAREQMRLLHANQPLLLSHSPMASVHNQLHSDRFGSVNQNRYESNNTYRNRERSNNSDGDRGRYEDNRGRDRDRHEDRRGRHEDSRGRDRDRHEDSRGRDRDRHEDSRGRDRDRHDDRRRGDRDRYDNNLGSRDRNTYIRGRNSGCSSLDNDAMQDIKECIDRDAEYNTKRLAELQQRQGRFDYNRLGPSLGSIGSRLGPPLGSIGGGSRSFDGRPDGGYNGNEHPSQNRIVKYRHDPYSRNNSHY